MSERLVAIMEGREEGGIHATKKAVMVLTVVKGIATVVEQMKPDRVEAGRMGEPSHREFVGRPMRFGDGGRGAMLMRR